MSGEVRPVQVMSLKREWDILSASVEFVDVSFSNPIDKQAIRDQSIYLY